MLIFSNDFIILQLQIYYLQMFPGFRPELYIKNKRQLQNFQCAHCFDLSTSILKCLGPCRKYICEKCKSQILYRGHSCRYCSRADRNWILTPVKDIPFQFFCPYSQLQHHPSITSVEQFVQHCYDCPNMSKDQQMSLKRMHNFECQEGHSLIFLSYEATAMVFSQRSTNSVLTNSECYLCDQNNLCRSACFTCKKEGKQKIYCVKCRKIPASKVKCPLGHNLTRRTAYAFSATCDFCLKDLGRQVDTQFGCRQGSCNLDICHDCYMKLPEENPILPMRLIIN